MKKRSGKSAGRSTSTRAIAELIEEATVDCYNESEAKSGFLATIDEYLSVPFRTSVLGMQVEVVGVDMLADETIVAICQRGRKRQRIPILDLPLPSPPPLGAEWIAAYRAWQTGGD